jgi:hypothetical protein
MSSNGLALASYGRKETDLAMTKVAKRIHFENQHLLNESLLGSLFGMIAGASIALMFALMAGRSWERSLILVVAGAVLTGGVMFAILYLHYLGRDGCSGCRLSN